MFAVSVREANVKTCLSVFVLPLSTSCRLFNRYDKSYIGRHRLTNAAGSYKFLEASVQLDIPMSVQLPTGQFFFFFFIIWFYEVFIKFVTSPCLHCTYLATEQIPGNL